MRGIVTSSGCTDASCRLVIARLLDAVESCCGQQKRRRALKGVAALATAPTIHESEHLSSYGPAIYKQTGRWGEKEGGNELPANNQHHQKELSCGGALAGRSGCGCCCRPGAARRAEAEGQGRRGSFNQRRPDARTWRAQAGAAGL